MTTLIKFWIIKARLPFFHIKRLYIFFLCILDMPCWEKREGAKEKLAAALFTALCANTPIQMDRSERYSLGVVDIVR